MISVCSLYPLVQLSTSLREWVSLLLLHYCVYEPSDTRSLTWNRRSLPNEIIVANAPQSSRLHRDINPSLGFIQQFNSTPRSNPCETLLNRTVNEDFLQFIYPADFANFRLPLNPLLEEIVTIRPGLYRCVYAGEDPTLLNDMNSNSNSMLVSGTSPGSPLTGQIPWSCCSPTFVTHLRNHYNRSQLFAIESALYNTKSLPVSHFTLIQGPPGTGKTRTLLLLLNVLQNKQFDIYYEQLRSYVNNVLFSSKSTFLASLDGLNRARTQMKERLVKPRILVCTPSNAAVNTIIDGIMRRGFIDNAGKRYNPSILRLGSGTSRDHWSVSLDYIVEVVSKDRHDC